MGAVLIGCLAILSHTVVAAEQLYGPRSPTDPTLSQLGEHAIGVHTRSMTWTTPFGALSLAQTPSRELRLEIWYPAVPESGAARAVYVDQTRSEKPFRLQGRAFRDAPPADGVFPLVVLSHGYTGYRTIMFYLGEHLASHGYMVVAPDHPGSTNAEIDSRDPELRRAGFPDTLIHRARDQQQVLEWFAKARNESEIAHHADSNTAALIGYSMGGYGGLNTVGGCYRFEPDLMGALGLPDSLREHFEFCNAGRTRPDPRWKALVALAPWGQLQGIHDLEALARVKVPALFIAGDEDPLSGFRPGVGELFDAMTSSPRYLLLYKNAGHNIAPHPAPRVAYDTLDSVGHYREAAWDTQTINRVNQHFVLAFLDCHVRQRADACNWLPEQGRDFQEQKTRWPGFAEGWRRGLRFFRSDAGVD